MASGMNQYTEEQTIAIAGLLQAGILKNGCAADGGDPEALFHLST